MDFILIIDSWSNSCGFFSYIFGISNLPFIFSFAYAEYTALEKISVLTLNQVLRSLRRVLANIITNACIISEDIFYRRYSHTPFDIHSDGSKPIECREEAYIQ